LPVGASNARIVVRDAFGREQVVTAPYYFSTGVLKAGISDYGFHAGFRRNNLATDSWDYAPAVFLGRYRFGFNDVLTPGGRVEGSRNLLSGGPQATWRTPVGDLEAAAAASYDGAPAAPGLATSGGAAGSLSFTHLRPRMNAGAMVRGTSRRYINLSLDAQRDRALVQGDAFAGATLGSRVSLSGRVGLARYRDAGNWSQLGLVGNIHLHELATLYVSGTRTEAETMLHPLYEVFASLTVTLPDRATASAFFQSQNTTASGGAEVQRAMGLGPDYGSRARVTQGTTTDALVSGLAQSEYGRYEATYERFGNRNLTILSTSGAFVTLGGHVFATRPVQQGYGLIQVPGAPGVRGTLNNQVVGRTDGDGNLLVPELIPYYANRLGIADDDLPLDYKVDASARLVAPPLRGGTVATFGVEKLHAVTGSVVMSLGGADVAPSFGQLTVKRGLDEVTSPLGKNGEFYFDNLPPGKYAAEVEAEAGTCKIDVVVPASPNAASAFVDAGRLRCLGRGVPEPGAPPSVEPPPAAAPTSGKGRTP
jgi:outer membrane usher protein